MLHHFHLNRSPFNKIKDGTKTIEIRLNDEKRQLIKVGDQIEFSLLTDETEKINTVVEDLRQFPTFRDLFYAFEPREYGSVSKDEYNLMYDYYSKEDESKYGALAIRIKLV